MSLAGNSASMGNSSSGIPYFYRRSAKPGIRPLALPLYAFLDASLEAWTADAR